MADMSKEPVLVATEEMVPRVSRVELVIMPVLVSHKRSYSDELLL